jgi:CubicO group peptidase (beta-lactamase class C family)
MARSPRSSVRTSLPIINRRRFIRTAGLAALATVGSASLAFAKDESGWRWCNKCQGLFFGDNLEKSTCPGGGKHALEGSRVYILALNEKDTRFQRGWRRCSQCQGLWFGRDREKGKCPAGGVHAEAGNEDYALALDGRGQDEWRYCRKCEGLWYGGASAGKCPAGGGHVKERSGNYTLRQHHPVSGKRIAGLEIIDEALTDFMDRIAAQAATVALSRDRRLLYARGFGWSDQVGKKPLQHDALMRIASVTKPITAAAIKKLIRTKRLSQATKAFDLLDLKAPSGKVADRRVYSITVGQLLEHKGGWDASASFDPMFRPDLVQKELKLDTPATPQNVVEFMMTQPLQFAPGEKSVYSNFGYCVLGRVLEKVVKKPYIDCIQQLVCAPLHINDIKLGHSALKDRDPREVEYTVPPDAYPLDIMDAHGGLIASSEALCQFLEAYWVSGEPRLPTQRENWTFNGSLPGTTSMLRQRNDGISFAVLVNDRRDGGRSDDTDFLFKGIDGAIDKLVKK